MKICACSVLAAAMVVLGLCGCQRAAAKTEEQGMNALGKELKSMTYTFKGGDLYKIEEGLCEWGRKMQFKVGKQTGDVFYRNIIVQSGSSIHFNFVIRQVDTQEVKLEIFIRHYEGKGEFKMIIESLNEVLNKLLEEMVAKQDKNCVGTAHPTETDR